MYERVQLRRAKGWRMPENTVKVDRSTLWGNPFLVGVDGTAAECVRLYEVLLAIGPCLTCKASTEAQLTARRHILKHFRELRGRNLACWCRLGAPCHADVLLKLANA